MILPFLLAFSFFVTFRLLNFCSIFIIVKEAVELHGNHAFNQVFLAEPFQFAVNSGQECFDFFFVYFDFFYIVDQLDQLLFADFLTGWQGTEIKFLFDDPFDLAHFTFFSQVDDGDGYTGFTGSSGTSATVSIAFRIIRQSVVDDMSQVIYIKTAGCYISRYQ